jgi:tetratricopeptide (TPR) repeat protein
MSSFDAMESLLPRLIRSDDPVIREVAGILRGQMLENRGLVAEAAEQSLSAHASATEHGHVWAAAMSASLLAQLHAQRADPEEALVWALRAGEGLEAIGARTDLQELQRRMASAEIALGRFESARTAFERLLNGDDEIPAVDRDDMRLIAATGLAEIAFREGRLADSLTGYDEAAAEIAGGRGPTDLRSWPQLVLSHAAAIAAHATREPSPQDPTNTDALARSLRVRLIAMHRVAKRLEDTPAIGAAAFALGSWLLWPARDAPSSTRAVGLRLVLLSAAMNSRQDFGSLETRGFLETIDERYDATLVAEARQATAGRTPSEAMNDVHALLADPRLRNPFDRA